MHLGRVATTLLLVLSLAACDPAEPLFSPPSTPAASAAPADVPSGGSFRYGIGQPRAITPSTAETGDDLAVVDAVFDSLTSWDVQGRPLPAAAASWVVNQDATEWTFQLRTDAQFSDGSPVTAQSFQAAWSDLAAHGPFGYLLSDVIGHGAVARGDVSVLSGVRVDGDLTLTVLLRRPRADFDAVAGHPSLGPMNLAQIQADAEQWRVVPAGNGPFALTESFIGNPFIRVTRFDGWVNGVRDPGSPTEVVFRIGDLDINYLAFTQGRRDLTAVPPEALELAGIDFPSTGGAWNGPGLIVGGRPETYVLGVNPAIPPYDQVAVREAVSLSLDRRAVVDQLEGANVAPATSLLPPALPGSQVGECDRCTLNIRGSESRLAEAGVTQLSMAFNAGGGHEVIRDSLRSSLSAQGVSLVSNGRGPAPALPEYQQQLAEGRVGLFRFPLVADVPSSLSVLYPLLHSQQVPERGGMNYMRYDNATVDSLLDQASRTTDAASRESLLSRVVDRALNVDQIVIPVFTYQHAMVASDQIRNLTYDPYGLVNLTDIVIGR